MSREHSWGLGRVAQTISEKCSCGQDPTHPADASLLAEILDSPHLETAFDAFGWHADETAWVAAVSKAGGTVFCSFASPNLSFWSLMPLPDGRRRARKLPSGDSGRALDRKYYVSA